MAAARLARVSLFAEERAAAPGSDATPTVEEDRMRDHPMAALVFAAAVVALAVVLFVEIIGIMRTQVAPDQTYRPPDSGVFYRPAR